MEFYTLNGDMFFSGAVLFFNQSQNEFPGPQQNRHHLSSLLQHIARIQYPKTTIFQKVIHKLVFWWQTLTCTSSVNLVFSATDLRRKDVSPRINIRMGDIYDGAVRMPWKFQASMISSMCCWMIGRKTKWRKYWSSLKTYRGCSFVRFFLCKYKISFI